MLRPLTAALCGALGLALLSGVAHAQDSDVPLSEASVVVPASPFSPINERIISDPLYLPAKGHLYGATGYTLGLPTSSSYNYLGVKKSTSHGHDNSVSQSFAYGLSDGLSLRMNLTYLSDSNDATTESTGATTTGNSKGFDDPTFGVTYRALNQARQHPVDIDFGLSYTPDLIASKTGGSAYVGTAAAGRQSVGLSASVGRIMRDFTIQASATANYLGLRKYQSLINGASLQQTGGWNYNFTLRSQVRTSRRVSFNGSIGHTFADDRASINNTTGLAWTSKEASSTSLSTGMNYHLIQNRLVLSLSYTRQSRGDSGSVYVNPVQNVQTRDASSDSIAIRLQYALN